MPAIILSYENRKKSILFSQIPKTGGTAIMNFFKQSGAQTFLYGHVDPIVGLAKCPTQHYEYKILDQILNIEKFDFSFAIMRDPLSRSKSDYLWSLRNSINSNANIPSFDYWFNSMVQLYEINPYILDNHIRPQSDFLGDKLSKIYRYEDGLEEVLNDVLENIGVNKRVETVERRNTSLKNTGLNSQNILHSLEVDVALRSFYERDFKIWDSLRFSKSNNGQT